MERRRRATLAGRWWQEHFKSILHCYRCGKELIRRYVREERRWRHVCGACGQITYVNPKIVAGLIPVMPDGRIALLRRDIEPALGRWSYPAGYQELGETVADAAVRETMEEIRTRVTVVAPLGLYSYADAGVVTVVYVGKVLSGEKPRAGAEAQEVALFDPKKLPWDELAFRSTTESLTDFLKNRAKLVKTRRKA
jgi:ADP-ribose pyrophosphatase YjhB (NUDIX family)